jgi:hypothetical protein
MHSGEFGFKRIRPNPAYFYVFPLDRRGLGQLAYFFDYDYGDGRRPQDYIAAAQRAVRRWREIHLEPGRAPRLDAEFSGDAVMVTDTREVATAPRHCLVGMAAEIYFLCDTPQTVTSLLQRPQIGADEPAIRAALAGLCDAKLLLELGGQFLSLAIFRNRTEHHKLETNHAHSLDSQAASSEPLLCVG